MDGNAGRGWEEFSGPNAAYLAELFERYSVDPGSVDPEIRAFFDRWGPPRLPVQAGEVVPTVAAPGVDCDLISAARALSTAIRIYGYRAARLDPLGSEPPGDPELLPENHGLREDQLSAMPPSVVGGPVAERAGSAREAIARLREVYLGTAGYEFEHVYNAEERRWLRDAVESGQYSPPRDLIDDRWLLERLTQAEAFERFLHIAFPAQTRFSMEGLDMLLPMLDELLGAAAEIGTQSVLLGMAHRGRLNILAHLLGKPYEEILAEFRGALQRPNVSASDGNGVGWTGDVKYHLGARRAFRGGREVGMLVTMAPNPSHLEYVDPVVAGMTRADSERRDQRGPARLDERVTLGVLIHGDASFVGEGIVAETLNLSMLPAYHTGGTVHIIANNQLGFTTPSRLGRSTLFASDLAKGFEIPIVHVNADDPEACISAVRLAHAYVERFHKDVLIDLIGYRRWGHNEGDEPSYTQPTMYAVVSSHPTVRDLWAKELVHRGLITPEESEGIMRSAMERLQAARRSLPSMDGVSTGDGQQAGLEAGGTRGGLGHQGVALEVETKVPEGTLAELNRQLLELPSGFKLNPKLEPIFNRRRASFAPAAKDAERGGIDWAHAEQLAFASLVAEGTPIRLTGQDTARGTFSQRHLVLHDVTTDATYTPLQQIPAARASFDVWDSPLSEASTMGFEFGYNIEATESLVLWEAQYGDFVDSAQVIIDSFVVAARSKWGEQSSLVLLLPHGYEGQGPDHSSARLERFLQMAAEDNLRIANCTTAAQYFHILRRQARLLKDDPRPLVLLTPKSLLRHPMAVAPIRNLVEGGFQPVIDDPAAGEHPEAVRRLILCSGRVYVDLAAAGQKLEGSGVDRSQVAIVRLEELYPFPQEELERVVRGYPGLEEVVWVQEEPRNMGAWPYAAPRLRDMLEGRLPLLYAGRPRRASPAEGSHEWHVQEQKRMVEAAFLREAPTLS
jgi:2-oxoglutarate dehydrogenase E1 component